MGGGGPYMVITCWACIPYCFARFGLSCWAGTAPETYAHSICCTKLSLFSHFFYIWCR